MLKISIFNLHFNLHFCLFLKQSIKYYSVISNHSFIYSSIYSRLYNHCIILMPFLHFWHSSFSLEFIRFALIIFWTSFFLLNPIYFYTYLKMLIIKEHTSFLCWIGDLFYSSLYHKYFTSLLLKILNLNILYFVELFICHI